MDGFESVSLSHDEDDHHGHGHSHGEHDHQGHGHSHGHHAQEPAVVQAFSNPDFQPHTHSFRSVLQQPASPDRAFLPPVSSFPPPASQISQGYSAPPLSQPPAFYGQPTAFSSSSSSGSFVDPAQAFHRKQQPAFVPAGSSFGSSAPFSLPSYSDRKDENFLTYLKSIWVHKEKRGFWIYETVRLLFSLLSLIFSINFESTALLCVAFQMFFDCLGAGVEMWTQHLYTQSTNDGYSYGYGRFEVLASFSNSIFMIFISLFTLQSCSENYFEPPHVDGSSVMTIAVLSVLVNLIGIFFFNKVASRKSGRRGSSTKNLLLNRIISDNFSGVCLIIASFVSEQYGIHTADPIVAAGLAVFILYTSIPIAKEAASVLLLTTPPSKHPFFYKTVQEAKAIAGVLEIYDAHFWTQYDSTHVATASVRISQDAQEPLILQQLHNLFRPLQITHLTFELRKDNWNIHAHH
eukprot:TRINITY_DN3868_c0_g1_i1.p1 TRINITY_DN3868_c0_g1~~TRINITY_DN3868_c0_g1_i1.p1  ORF type:complete len:472 (-),score=208.30 TRINITY_DN3868_c0_g1_i1:136-1521(-)